MSLPIFQVFFVLTFLPGYNNTANSTIYEHVLHFPYLKHKYKNTQIINSIKLYKYCQHRVPRKNVKFCKEYHFLSTPFNNNSVPFPGLKKKEIKHQGRVIAARVTGCHKVTSEKTNYFPYRDKGSSFTPSAAVYLFVAPSSFVGRYNA